MIRKGVRLAVRCALALVNNEAIVDRGTAMIWATQEVSVNLMRTSRKWSAL